MRKQGFYIAYPQIIRAFIITPSRCLHPIVAEAKIMAGNDFTIQIYQAA
jgi:hypothetical protein